IWDRVNTHLGTTATFVPELVEQLGIMRFGRRPIVGDAFAGSGQIPFEAARLGCDAHAFDLNPIACMLSWGAFNVVGAAKEDREHTDAEQAELARWLEHQLEDLGFEDDGHGWKAKTFLYCLEARCPESGWMVPLLPTRLVSKGGAAIAELVPNRKDMRYDIIIRSGCTDEELEAAKTGTVRDEPGIGSMVVHNVDGVDYRTPLVRIRGDGEGTNAFGNRLRPWEKDDIAPHPADIFQERLYAIQWVKARAGEDRSRRLEFEFRSITSNDRAREAAVAQYVSERLKDWQRLGFVPDMRIEPGVKTNEPMRTRGWTHWHHFFNPRQLLTAALLRSNSNAATAFRLTQVLNNNCRSSRWHPGAGGGGATVGIFDNQALSTLLNYGARGSIALRSFIDQHVVSSPIADDVITTVTTTPAASVATNCDLWVCDPPYASAVVYEEILEFFIAWFRKNPPVEFADWVWDSRRSLAVTGEDHAFKQAMIDAYTAMTRSMPDNGINVLMFTHQSGKVWADIASIVWGAGLQVTAAWYVTTETDSALRQGAYVKGTIMLALRKRQGDLRTFQDDLAYELETEVKQQVAELVGLNQRVRENSARDESAFNDADLQMAGYAAALRALTKYRTIDGKDMVTEAKRPRAEGEKTVVDTLIDFAVDLANAALVPEGITEDTWGKLAGIERFYLKMLEQEAHGVSSLDSYQQFSKAFRVRDSGAVMASLRANQARLKSSVELGRSEMHEASEFGGTTLRAVLFAMQQLAAGADRDKVLTGLRENVADYYQARGHVRALAQYLKATLGGLRSEEAEHARLVDL
ncbi:MAG: DNA methylase, partial [Thioalkalivibrio sp.]|nr:DNA methylase [Thioalkalivibrio sp.]